VGLQDFNARWFDTSLGMFASSDSLIPDPFDPQGLNRYSYAFSNPLRYTDPTGHMLSECGQFGEECGGSTGPSIAPTIQVVKTPQPTPSPSPSEQPPTATPSPPGFPSATSTPTAAEILASYQRAKQQWLYSFGSAVQGCWGNVSDPGCLVRAGSLIYTHYGWDLVDLARSGEDNLLAPESAEARLISPVIVIASNDPVSQDFVRSLGLTADYRTNYEPAFFGTLTQEFPQQYQAAQRRAGPYTEYHEFITQNMLRGVWSYGRP